MQMRINLNNLNDFNQTGFSALFIIYVIIYKLLVSPLIPPNIESKFNNLKMLYEFNYSKKFIIYVQFDNILAQVFLLDHALFWLLKNHSL